MAYYPYITANQALKANLGITANCIWETVTIGYRADIWQHNGDVSIPIYSKEFSDYKDAKKWSYDKMRSLFQAK